MKTMYEQDYSINGHAAGAVECEYVADSILTKAISALEQEGKRWDKDADGISPGTATPF